MMFSAGRAKQNKDMTCVSVGAEGCLIKVFDNSGRLHLPAPLMRHAQSSVPVCVLNVDLLQSPV